MTKYNRFAAAYEVAQTMTAPKGFRWEARGRGDTDYSGHAEYYVVELRNLEMQRTNEVDQAMGGHLKETDWTGQVA